MNIWTLKPPSTIDLPPYSKNNQIKFLVSHESQSKTQKYSKEVSYQSLYDQEARSYLILIENSISLSIEILFKNKESDIFI